MLVNNIVNYILDNPVTVFEILGAFFINCKATNEEKYNIIVDFFQEMEKLTKTLKIESQTLSVDFLSGIIKLYSSKSLMKYSKIIAEEFYFQIKLCNFNQFFEEKLNKSLINTEEDFLYTENSSIIEESKETNKSEKHVKSAFDKELELFHVVLENLKVIRESLGLNVSISRAIEIFKSNSLLGQINRGQIISALTKILDEQNIRDGEKLKSFIDIFARLRLDL
jgi:hypothetical protein